MTQQRHLRLVGPEIGIPSDNGESWFGGEKDELDKLLQGRIRRALGALCNPEQGQDHGIRSGEMGIVLSVKGGTFEWSPYDTQVHLLFKDNHLLLGIEQFNDPQAGSFFADIALVAEQDGASDAVGIDPETPYDVKTLVADCLDRAAFQPSPERLLRAV